jgi:pyruvate dehydrogenase E2 component (dihydrolipoamide acetyltransferase)
MSKEIKMPQISEDADSGTIVDILVKEGDTIEEEQSIITVESDKASVDVPSPAGGTVKEIKVSDGDEIKVGDLILVLEGDGENKEEEEEDESEKEDKKSEDAASKKKDKGESDDSEEEEDEVEEDEKEDEEEKIAAKDKSSEEDEKPAKEKKDRNPEKEEDEIPQDEESRADVPAAPSVRRLSRELGIDIHQVEGTGPGQRITTEDVKAYAKDIIRSNGKQQAPTLPDFSKWGDVKREKASNIRKITAEGTTRSWQTIPHVTQFDKADMAHLETFMEQYGEQAEKAGGKLTITAILLKIASAALKTFPKFNASIDMQKLEIIYKNYYHIGIAADTEQGLLVPVIRDVNKKTIIELSVELSKVAEKARNGKLSPEEMQGGTFTISNLGGIGGTQFTPIIYNHQAAILGVSRAATEPVFEGGTFEPKTMLPLALSYDHRLIDGAEAARFLRWMCRVIEDPAVMLMEGKV